MDNKERSWEMKFLMRAGTIIGLMMLLSGPTCGAQWLLYYNKPMKGQVIDNVTGAPIPGAIVVGLWRLSGILGGGSGGYAKIIETNTDKDGKFWIPPWINIKPWKLIYVTHDHAPEVAIYKPGYELYFTHRVAREGFKNYVDVLTPAQMEEAKKANSFDPAKLRRAETDEEIWENHRDFRLSADFPYGGYSKGQLADIFYAIDDATKHLPDANHRIKNTILNDVAQGYRFYLGGKK